ncbi:uncharacterized protein [Parasteatoda tepidariorum]|uniref:uncharacterized protein n=1 Tax=Parasteatoda tepidariorum TaxID=114398 RepID=UPI00077FAD90|nr:uncharacterized protein LOC107448639 [Parasteatoda tepidariorum]
MSFIRDKLFKPDVFIFTGFLLIVVTKNVLCRPKGGSKGRGSSVLYGNRGTGRLYFTSARWAALSPATKVLVFIFCGILGIFLLVGLYRAYVWCTKEPGRR